MFPWVTLREGPERMDASLLCLENEYNVAQQLRLHGGCAPPMVEAARLPCVCPVALGYRVPPLSFFEAWQP